MTPFINFVQLFVKSKATKSYNTQQRTNNNHLLRAQEVKVKGLAMLKKVQGVVSGRNILNNYNTTTTSHSTTSSTTYLRPNITFSRLSSQSKPVNNIANNINGLLSNNTNSKVNINGMNGFANRLSNVWKKNTL